MNNALKERVHARAAALQGVKAYDVGDDLPLDQIRADGGTQARASLDNATIEAYAEAMKNGANFPFIIVYHDGTNHWLADGFHRVKAARAAGRATLRAEVRMGTLRDAILHAVGANDTHGLRRTNADKRRAIETMLNDDEWRQWSDSEIARRVVVDHKTVASVRANLYPGNSQDSRTVERGGTTYQQKRRQPTHEPPKPEQRGARGPGQPEPDPWPDPPAGWRWNRRGSPAHLIAPDGWTTHDYNYPDRAIAEAERRMLSQPKPAPSDEPPQPAQEPPAPEPAHRTWSEAITALRDVRAHAEALRAQRNFTGQQKRTLLEEIESLERSLEAAKKALQS